MSELGEHLVISQNDGALVVSGELDAHTAPQLAEAIGNVSGDAIVVDMAGVEFVDSSGLRALIDAHQAAEAADRRLVIREPSSSVQRLFDISGVLDYLNVASD